VIVAGGRPPRVADPGARGAARAGVAGATGAFAIAFESLVFTDLTASFSPGSRSMYFCATNKFPWEATISTNSVYLSYRGFKSPPIAPFVCLNTVTFSTNPCRARA